MKLKYGEKEIVCPLAEDKIMKIITAREKKGLIDPLQEIKKCINNSIGTPALKKLVEDKEPGTVAIIVNDITRPTPYNHMLPPVLENLHKAGIKKEQITFYIATGIHAPHTREQNIEVFGRELVENYRFISHDPDRDLVYKGKLASGNKFYVNREVDKADFIILTGIILPHYFAGFSGGRKSILPGVAGRETIETNHAWMVKLMGHLPPVEENPVSNEMLAAAERMEVDYILNAVTNSKREIVKIVAGDLKKAWQEGVKVSASMYYVEIESKADVTIVSAGGYPRDINVYQAQKALDHANHATKDGGTIILLAECRDGLGEKTFAKWMKEAETPEDNIQRIRRKFVLGGHKAFAVSKVAQSKEIILLSELTEKTTEMLFAKKCASLAKALVYAEKKHGSNFKAVIMPQGSLTVPVVS